MGGSKADKARDVLPSRAVDHLHMLRESYSRESFACSSLHHILVAFRDNLTAEVLYGPRQRIWDQAENRRHAQKALLEWLVEAL